MGLSSREKRVMRAVLSVCDGAPSCLIRSEDLFEKITEKQKLRKGERDMTSAEMDRTLRLLEMDGYFDVIRTYRHGEPVLCICLHGKGVSFEREEVQTRRYLFFKFAVTVGFAVLSFLVGKILVTLF